MTQINNAQYALPTTKQCEFILGMGKLAALEIFGGKKGVITHDPIDFVEKAYPHLLLRPRASFEGKNDEVHFIPYITLTDTLAEKVVAYDRPSKNNGEVKLAGKSSVGFGGHLDMEDVVFDKNRVDLIRSFLAAALRELNEELAFVHTSGETYVSIEDIPDAHLTFDGFILDWDAVGLCHIGVAMSMDLRNVAVAHKEDQCLNPRWEDVPPLLAKNGLEGWSELVLRSRHC